MPYNFVPDSFHTAGVTAEALPYTSENRAKIGDFAPMRSL